MFDLDYWSEIWYTISRNKIRSLLTGFGVFWGILILIILIGLGNGLSAGIMAQVEGFAANSCFFMTDRTSEPYKGFRKGRWWNINNRDVELIRRQSNSVEYISPMIWGPSSDKNVTRGSKNGSYSNQGVYADYFKVQQVNIQSGRLFNNIDLQDNRKVCIIGKTIYETLFNVGEEAEGQFIRINGIYFQVIGVISPKSNASIGGDPNETVLIPFTTMQRAFNQGDVVHFLACTAKPGLPVSMVEDEVTTILKASHSIAPNDKKAVRAINIEKQFQIFNMLHLGVGFLIFFVGLGTLLSGVIGISNIMMVSVKERTSEIGVRRALGAKPFNILAQILNESFLLTLLSGVMAVLLGVAIVETIAYFVAKSQEGSTEIHTFLPPFISLGVALSILAIISISGILAGIMPALRALKIKAIDAIREE